MHPAARGHRSRRFLLLRRPRHTRDRLLKALNQEFSVARFGEEPEGDRIQRGGLFAHEERLIG